jgi:GntR family transcriptional regulator/MocR family aminotransferase
MIHSLTRASHGAITLAPSFQGLHLAFEADERVRDTELSRRAENVGVQLAPISHYCIEARRRGWLFGYAGYREAALARAAYAVGQQLR